jgi:hypothetical protein
VRVDDSADDDPIVHGALVLLGLVRLIPAVAFGERFGAELTVAALMVVVGLAGVMRR